MVSGIITALRSSAENTNEDSFLELKDLGV
jgi:hypothetical protein